MTTSPPPLPVVEKPSGNDFPDWLSPILVKELRQGLKSRGFVSVFVLLQACMALMFLLASLGGLERGGDGLGALDGFFWVLLWIPLILVMPARSLQAVTEERKAQTLELVQMTRMQSLRIVLGKWLALNVQSVLLVVAILPYVVLRYFFGGVDLMSNVGTLGTLGAASLVLTAAGLAASALNAGVRIVLTVGAVMGLLVGGQVMAMTRMGGGTGGVWWPAEWWVALLTMGMGVGAYVGFFLLAAAGHLSTQTESYSGWKRRWALGWMLVVMIGLLLEETMGWELTVLVTLLPIGLWTMVEALCERNDPDWEAAEGERLRWWKVWLTSPGWASGWVYSWVLAGIFAGLTVLAQPGEAMMAAMVSLIFYGAVLTPALLLVALPKVRQRVLCYWLFQLAFGLLFSAAMMASLRPNLREEDALMWLTPLPTCTAFGLLQQEFDADFVLRVFPISGGVSAVVVLILGVLAGRYWRAGRGA